MLRSLRRPEGPPPPPPEAVRRLLSAAALPIVILAAGCRIEPPPVHRTLLGYLEPAVEAGRTTACPDPEAPGGQRPAAAPEPVIRAQSRRPAVLTCDGVTLVAGLELPAGTVLDLSLARVDRSPGSAPATATVELRRDGASTPLLQVPVEGGGWRGHRIDLDAGVGGGGRAELVLRSDGGGSVAWAEVRLAGGAPPAERPSLVLVSLDTVRADHLSLYGYGRPTTPNLERLGADSLVFERALSSSTWTLPSTATLLTGLLPSQHGAVHVSKELAPEVRAVAERLRGAGYRTAALTDGGFAGFHWGLGQGFDRYDVTPGEAWEPRAKDAARTFREAAAWVRRHRAQPFFLFVHTYEAHQPYMNREGFADPFLGPEDRGREDLAVPVDPRLPAPPEEEVARMAALYDGEIARADHYLGELLDALEEEGLSERVAVIVTSDHGEELLEHGDLEHAFGKVFDPNVRVPLVVRPPGGAPGGRRVAAPVAGIDVAPTLLDLAGLPHDDLPGRSLLAEAADGGDRPAAGRAVLVHGLPSLPRRRGERFRLDAGGESVILDRTGRPPASELLRYEPAAARVEPWPDGAAAEAPVPRLATVLAWLQSGDLFARLPDDVRRLAAAEGSRVRLRGAWSGGRWLEVSDGGPLELAPEPPHVLVFDLAPGPGPWEEPWGLLLERAGAAGPAPYRLTATRRPPWDPFSDPLPPTGAVLPTATLLSAEAATLDEDTARELRALGYLD